MSDEEVIKRRLLIDGDGTGDDRRLNVLIKSFVKWCNTNDTPENTQIGYDRILAQLAQCEFTVTKSDFASKMMKNELKNYAKISQTIDSGIEHAKKQIEQSKENLVLAKKIRKNRMEYDVLAKIINQQPDRKKTTESLEALKKELNELENNRKQLQRKLEIRRNEFSVLMRSIKELQTKLDEENEQIDALNSNDSEENNGFDTDDDKIEQIDLEELDEDTAMELDSTFTSQNVPSADNSPV